MVEDKSAIRKLSAKEKFHLKSLLNELSAIKGRHTELVSYYVPAGYDLTKVIHHLQDEQDTAVNIKSTVNRKAVQDALEKMIQYLKQVVKVNPPNGLAIFSGNTAERDGQYNYKVWAFEPPVKMNQRLYRCDKEFILDHLRDLLAVDDVYGLVVMDMRDATIGLLRGKTIISLRTTHSEVPGKMKAGGQSAQRFERLRDGAIKDHYKKVADYMVSEFLFMDGLKGIIIGGPSTTVNNFMNKNYLNGDIRKKILGTKDLSYTGYFGLQELVEKSSDILANEEVSKEKELVNKFLKFLSLDPDRVAYGEKEVLEFLEAGVVDTVLVSEALSDKFVQSVEEIALNFNTAVELISLETAEGVQLKSMGGIAAILRYAVERH